MKNKLEKEVFRVGAESVDFATLKPFEAAIILVVFFLSIAVGVAIAVFIQYKIYGNF